MSTGQGLGQFNKREICVATDKVEKHVFEEYGIVSNLSLVSFKRFFEMHRNILIDQPMMTGQTETHFRTKVDPVSCNNYNANCKTWSFSETRSGKKCLSHCHTVKV